MLSLVAVLIVGDVRNGSRAWFALGPFSLQPSEAVKVALTLWGAHVLVARQAALHRWRYALSPVVPVAVLLMTLLVLQPDLGMTVSLGVVLIALLYFGGAPLRLIVADHRRRRRPGPSCSALTADYRLSRITAFLSPETADPLEAGYQARQALYSLADGGLFGVGLGQGRAKWSYLPNAHNDFIFAIIGEELGLPRRVRGARRCSPRWPTPGSGSPRATPTRGSRSSSPPRPPGWSRRPRSTSATSSGCSR